MITDNVEQRSLTWYRLRCGCITGSKVADIMKSGRKKDEVWSDTAKAYLFQIAGERLFNPTFLNDDDKAAYNIFLEPIRNPSIIDGMARFAKVYKT